MKVTMNDVAMAAQTSIATVSRVINNPEAVTEELRNRVMEAIREIGYQEKARQTNEPTRLIAVLISDITNSFLTMVVKGIQDSLFKHGYDMLLYNNDIEEISIEQACLEAAVKRGVDGLIISAAAANGKHFEQLDDKGIPYVFLNRKPTDARAPAVITDNINGAYQATAHLINLGHTRIATIAGPQDINTGSDRLRGFIQALSDNGYELDELHMVKKGDFTERSGYQRMLEVLQMGEGRPTGVLVANNAMTLGAIRAIQEFGLAIPEQIAIVGFDETEWAAIIDPPLTTIAQPTHALGVRAAELLLNELQGGEMAKEDTLLQPQLLVRASCGGNRFKGVNHKREVVQK